MKLNEGGEGGERRRTRANEGESGAVWKGLLESKGHKDSDGFSPLRIRRDSGVRPWMWAMLYSGGVAQYHLCERNKGVFGLWSKQ